jgi:hypothetical protein
MRPGTRLDAARSAGALGSAASQRVIETVIAPEHVLAHEECGRTEYCLGSGEFSLIAQPQLVALVLGGIEPSGTPARNR